MRRAVKENKKYKSKKSANSKMYIPFLVFCDLFWQLLLEISSILSSSLEKETFVIYPTSRGYIFAEWAVVQWVASADNSSILFSMVHAQNSSSDSQAQLIVRSVVEWCKSGGNKKIVNTLICYARLTQCSKPVENRKKTCFFNLLVQTSGRIWTVVGRGYFLHDSSHSKNVASARRVFVIYLPMYYY